MPLAAMHGKAKFSFADIIRHLATIERYMLMRKTSSSNPADIPATALT